MAKSTHCLRGLKYFLKMWHKKWKIEQQSNKKKKDNINLTKYLLKAQRHHKITLKKLQRLNYLFIIFSQYKKGCERDRNVRLSWY